MGNARVFFSDRDGNGSIEVSKVGGYNEVLQQEHYYPFGMGIRGEWKFVQPQIGGVNQYQYNGKELNDDFGLNWSDYGARWYDASIGRWGGVDPLAEDYVGWSGYNYVMGNPIRLVDPDGMRVDDHFLLNQKTGELTWYSNEGGDDYDVVTGANVFEGKDYDVYYISTYAGIGVPTRSRDANGVPTRGIWEEPNPLPSGAIDIFLIEDLAIISPKAIAKGASRAFSRKAGTEVAERAVTSTRWMPNPAYGQVAIGAQLRKGAKIPIDKGGTLVETASGILKPQGKLIGEQIGPNPLIRTVSRREADNTVSRLITSGARLTSKPRYPGRWYELPNNGSFGIRATNSQKSIRLGSSGTIDLKIPGVELKKLKY